MTLNHALPGRYRPARPWLIAASSFAMAVAVTPALPLTADAAPAAVAPTAAAPADNITVATTSGTAYRVSGDVVSGGVAVLDDIFDYSTASVTGQAALAGNVATTFAVTKGLFGLSGSIKTSDPGAGVQINANVKGGVTRVSDDTVRWSGWATVTRGSASTWQNVTVTLIDRAIDPGNHAVHITHANQARNAIVHVPTGKGGVQGLPAVFHFPGLIETPMIAHLFGKLEPASDQNGYLLVTPEHFGVGWQGVQGGTTSPNVDDPGFVRALAETVQTRFGADVSRTYASGMSNGGFFTSLMACQLPDVFAAFAPVSGQLNDAASCTPGRKIPVIMFHGDADPIVSYDTAPAAARFFSTNNGCSVFTNDTNLPDVDPNDGTTVIRHEYRDCPANAPVVLYQIVGGGHAWPGGDPYPLVPLGPATKDINGNQLIWNFVSRFTLAS
jgi:poly(3-hydroxybutyrate) depolymerase